MMMPLPPKKKEKKRKRKNIMGIILFVHMSYCIVFKFSEKTNILIIFSIIIDVSKAFSLPISNYTFLMAQFWCISSLVVVCITCEHSLCHFWYVTADHDGYWWPAIKEAPGHQLPICWLDCDCCINGFNTIWWIWQCQIHHIMLNPLK